MLLVDYLMMTCRAISRPSHGVLITGRKWNDDIKRCEYRVVNSHGSQCEGVIENDDVTCSKQTGMWVSESYLKLLHYSHEYVFRRTSR